MMRLQDNIIFVLIVFFFVFIILSFFPNSKSKKFRIEKDETIIKVETDPSYSAIISQDSNNNSNNVNSPSITNTNTNSSSKFKLSNLKILDKENMKKDTFIFNENINLVFDYELPPGYFTFKVETIPEVKINLNKDILRTGKGNTKENPLELSINYRQKFEDILVEKINILIYQTADYEIPVYNQVFNVNITIKNLNINLIREDDYTSPLLINSS
jgi:hypothetical protein